MMLCEGVWKCLAAPAEAGSASAATRATTRARRVTPNKVRRAARKGQLFLTAREGAVVGRAERVEHAVEDGLGLAGVDGRGLRLGRRLDRYGLGRWRRLGLRHGLG